MLSPKGSTSRWEGQQAGWKCRLGHSHRPADSPLGRRPDLLLSSAVFPVCPPH